MDKLNSPGFHSLSRRIVMQFCAFTLALSVVYGFITFILMYTIEDQFIERDVLREATYLTAEFNESGQWPAARSRNMTLHFSKDTFPDDIRETSKEEPWRSEFYGGNDRHYHMRALDGFEDVYLVAEVSKDLLVRPMRAGVIQFLAWSAVALSVIACLLAWLIGRKTARPLKQLAELVDGVEPELVPKQFADKFPSNEIGILARTLEQSLHRMTQALERERCFTRDVSHELRTPLAIIKNATELYLKKASNHHDKSAILNRIMDASEQMDKTVYTLLMLAREEHTHASKEKVDLMRIIERSIIDHSRLLEGKPVEVKVDDNCDTHVFAQAGMLKVLLDNLLSNAFQYTPSGEVSISYIDDALVVQDTGPGIEQEISEDVTQPAIKGSQSTGFGFGMSIVKRLCEHEGWTLHVDSKNGTTVSIGLS